MGVGGLLIGHGNSKCKENTLSGAEYASQEPDEGQCGKSTSRTGSAFTGTQ